MTSNNQIQKITRELKNAIDAEENGKEGLARVCARRATGWAIKEHLKAIDIFIESPSAIDHIKFLIEREETSDRMRNSLGYMLQKVEKDSLEEDSYWPLPEVHLIEEAKWIIEELLGITIDISQ